MKKLELFYDTETGEAFFQGISVAIEGEHTMLSEIQKECEKIIGPSTRVIMYNAAKKFSREIFPYYLSYKGITSSKTNTNRRITLELLNLLSNLGYGLFSIESYDEEKLEFFVKVKNCCNALIYGKSNKQICYAISGVLAYLFELVFRKEMFCEEVSCSSQGHKFCRFKITSLKKKYTKKTQEKCEIKIRKGYKREYIYFDENTGKIRVHGLNVLIFPRCWIAEIQKEFERIIGPATKTIFYNINKKCTINDLPSIINSNIIAKILKKLSKRRLMFELFRDANMFGYGIIELQSFNENAAEFKIKIKNCYNSIGYINTKKPICYYTTGLISGAAEVIFGRGMDCTETKCKGKGDDYCEFYVYPAKY